MPGAALTKEHPGHVRPRPLLRYLLPVVYLSAAYQFLRCYVSYPYFYLRLPEYLSGRERLPFQVRVLPIPFLKAVGANPLIQRFSAGRIGPMHNPYRLAFFLLSCAAFAVVYVYLVKLYRCVSLNRRLEFLLFPVFLFIAIWTYVLHIEQNFSYPYDMPSLAFFTAGIYYIYRRQFLPLVLVMLLGTFNRETTLLLIGIFMLDAASIPGEAPDSTWRERFRLSAIPWRRVLLLAIIWAAIEIPLNIVFRYNDRSEDHLRISENIIRLLKPNYWPAALNLGGYLLPFVVLLRTRIRPQRFANYLGILVPWVVIIFCQGILLETRVYGELSCYLAVAVVVIFEQYIDSLTLAPGTPAERTSLPHHAIS